ncbi:hypothetical protein AAFF_G00300590 [Aldrovandia affinis]|uniref:PDEase domain-containing protein n=1 Tax=Aldrovandia affinis TaxID=143900 RepID=A0AAD7WRM2_9TELE|nr:hypothetical protein AAFF_G00300590 [Aldrovandia affinis]
MILWDWDLKQWYKPQYQGSVGGSGVDLSVINEARNLVSELLSDPSLPPHTSASLRSVSRLMGTFSGSCRPRPNPFTPFPGFYPCAVTDDPTERKQHKVMSSRNSLPTPQLRRSSTSSPLEAPPLRWERPNSKRLHSELSNTREAVVLPNGPRANLLTIPKQRSSSVTLTYHAGPRRAGTSPSLSPVTSPSHSPPAIGSALATRIARVEFPDTADFLTKPSVTLRRPFSCTLSPPDFQQQLRCPSMPLCSSCGRAMLKSVPGAGEEPLTAVEEVQLRRSGEETEGVVDAQSGTEVQRVRVPDRACPAPVEAEQDTEDFSLDPLLEEQDTLMEKINSWNFQIFDLVDQTGGKTGRILSYVTYTLFQDTGLFGIFKIPVREFMAYFCALENGYRDIPYHNRVHATDVLHAVWYLTTRPIPGFQQIHNDHVTGSDTGSYKHSLIFCQISAKIPLN